MRHALSWVLGLILAFSLGCSSPRGPQDIPPEVVSWSYDNVYNLRYGEQKRGSTFWINQNHLITACHVVNKDTGDKQWIARSYDWKIKIPVKVEMCDTGSDLALLSALTPNPRKVQKTYIQTKLPVMGKQLFASGYPHLYGLLITHGHYQGIDWSEFTKNPPGIAHYVTAPTISGDSGSPLLDYSRGRVYVVGVRQKVSATALATPYGRFLAFNSHIVGFIPSIHIKILQDLYNG